MSNSFIGLSYFGILKSSMQQKACYVVVAPEYTKVSKNRNVSLFSKFLSIHTRHLYRVHLSACPFFYRKCAGKMFGHTTSWLAQLAFMRWSDRRVVHLIPFAQVFFTDCQLRFYVKGNLQEILSTNLYKFFIHHRGKCGYAVNKNSLFLVHPKLGRWES